MEPLLTIIFVLISVALVLFAGVLIELIWTMPPWLIEKIRIDNEYRARRRAAAAIGKQMKGEQNAE